MFPLILSMSFCGSIVFVFYLLVRPFAQKYFHVRWRYRILKLSLMFYLVPFPKLKFFLLKRMLGLFPKAKEWLTVETAKIDTQAYIHVAENGTWIPWRIRILWIAFLLTGIATVVLICIRWLQYCRLKQSCLHNSFTADSPDLEAIVTETSRKLKVRRKIPLSFSPFLDSPVTIGVLSPRILLPTFMKADMSKKEQLYLITHELNHIKSQDVAVRFLALLTTAVHWFNPLCYLLHREVREVSEYQCDACTLMGTGDSQRIEYSNLLVRLATEFPQEETSSYAAHLVNQNSKLVGRRIIEMKQNKGKRNVMLSYILGGLICIAGTIPVFAYAPTMVCSTDEKVEDLEEFLNSENVFSDGFDTDSIVIPMPYDYFWQGDDGTMVPLDEETQPEPREACDHDYQSGTTSSHTKLSGGGCKVVVRECKRCSLCGNLVRGQIINTINYAVCPH